MSDNVCNNGYDDLEDFNIGEEYHEADGDCVEEEYYYEEDADNQEEEVVDKEEDVEGGSEQCVGGEEEEEEEEKEVEQEEEQEEEELDDNQYDYPLGDESVDLHGEEEEDNVVFSSGRNQPDEDEECEEEAEEPEAEEEDISQDEDDAKQDLKEDEDEEKEGDGEDKEVKEEEEKEEKEGDDKEEEKEIECTMTDEEKLAEYLILDGFQRQIDEEQYTLRKLRSIIGHQTDDIERLRRKIAGYTEEAEDRKALQGMEKLKVLKAEREAAVEERRVSTDAQAEVRIKRNEKLKELRDKGLKIDPRATYLIEDKELKELLHNIKSTLKYNSFATLKVSMEELEDIIFNVANVCDDIDDFLTTKEIKPRDINKLNTKERRVSVLYDKLVKWRQYKVENPDIRPTEYESFMYDPEDMFSDNEEEKRKRKEPPPRREIRAVRGGSSDKSPVKERISSKVRTPVRAPSPGSARKSSPAAAAATGRPERRAVRGGSDDEEGGDVKPVRAERGRGAPSSSRGRRVPPVGDVRKRRAGPIEGGPNFKKRNMSPVQPRRSRFSPTRSNRPPSPRMERRQSPREDRRSSGPPRSDRGRQDSGRARSTPLLRTPNSNYDNRRSPSPPFKGGRRENFQISVRNESYRSRSPIQERGYRHERLSPEGRSPSRSRGSFRGARGGSGRGRGFNNRRPRRSSNFHDRRTDSYRR